MKTLSLPLAEEFAFDDEEKKRIDEAVGYFVEFIKKRNFTYAEALQALKICEIQLKTLKVN